MNFLEKIRLSLLLDDFMIRFDFLEKNDVNNLKKSFQSLNFEEIYNELYKVMMQKDKDVAVYFSNKLGKPIEIIEKIDPFLEVKVDFDELSVKIDELFNSGLSKDEVFIKISRSNYTYNRDDLGKIYNFIGEWFNKKQSLSEKSVDMGHVKTLKPLPKVS